jgi:pimeloyl-ACP methyl ester carboxylesterase
MPSSHRSSLAAFLAALLVSAGAMAQAVGHPDPTPAEDPRFLPYTAPAQLIDIGGRRLNVVCMGDGRPTVVLMAGLSSWSVVWYKTQAVIAKRTRVCSFDRAARGFSDPPSHPQVLSDAVDDLHAALNAGTIPGPYVLVGHSLGGIEARVFTERWPSEVVGMVLVDTSPAGEGFIDATQPGTADQTGLESFLAHELECSSLAAHGRLVLGSSELKDCSPTVPAGAPAALMKLVPGFYNAEYYLSKVSLMSSVYTHRYDSADHLRLGSLPLVVLSPEDSWSDGTPAGDQFSRAYSKKWIAMHEALAHLSSRGVHRYIPGSGHGIQLDKPQAVIDAVESVLAQLQATKQ